MVGDITLQKIRICVCKTTLTMIKLLSYVLIDNLHTIDQCQFFHKLLNLQPKTLGAKCIVWEAKFYLINLLLKHLVTVFFIICNHSSKNVKIVKPNIKSLNNIVIKINPITFYFDVITDWLAYFVIRLTKSNVKLSQPDITNCGMILHSIVVLELKYDTKYDFYLYIGIFYMINGQSLFIYEYIWIRDLFSPVEFLSVEKITHIIFFVLYILAISFLNFNPYN